MGFALVSALAGAVCVSEDSKGFDGVAVGILVLRISRTLPPPKKLEKVSYNKKGKRKNNNNESIFLPHTLTVVGPVRVHRRAGLPGGAAGGWDAQDPLRAAALPIFHGETPPTTHHP